MQHNCGLLLTKLKFFVGDFIVFTPRSSAQTDIDIESAVNGGIEKKFCVFTESERTSFDRITRKLGHNVQIGQMQGVL